MFKLFISFSILLLTVWVFGDEKKLKVGLVLDKGGKDDKSFNAAAYRGATEAQSKFNVQLKVVESSDDSAIEPSIRTFAQRGFDLIISIGFVQEEAVKKVAKEFPKVKFLIVDAPVTAPNVRSVMFQEHEGSYLMGAIAALKTKTNAVGFIGGMDIPLIRRFELAYRKGAESVNPKIKVITNYVGSSSDAWRNPTKGKELALNQIKKDVDVIFAAAGASATGAFDAVEQTNKLIIGCDSNQNYLKPGKVLTSMIKGVDVAVFTTIEQTVKNEFKAGEFYMGLKEKGVDYALDSFNKPLWTPELEKKVNDIKAKIIAKKVTPPDYYLLKTK
jgi:basic membrane protein A